MSAANDAGNDGMTAGNDETVDSGDGMNAGNQPSSWNESNEPGSGEIDDLGPRADTDRPYAVVGDQQPTDPDGDGLYEDINGDGRVNIVDADALNRNLSSTAVGANWTAYDFTNDSRTDTGDIQWLFANALSVPVDDGDSDGLPNEYEVDVTGTDPQDEDSDDDGVIDGSEDWDGDGLTAYQEFRDGTDPRSADTDGDGLADDFERGISAVDATDNDSDGDGVTDGEEDLDGDGLSLSEESDYGTLYTDTDTDGDDLSDGAEVNDYGTDPTVADTDSDGLDDGSEIELGTDPLTADTDGDGTLDGNETFTTTATNESVNATVDVTGEGDVAGETSITETEASSSVSNNTLSEPVEFTTEKDFDSANITLSYDESAVSDDSNASMYWFNESLGTYERLDSTVDSENNTVTTTTTHFSTYVVFNESSWQEYLESRSALNESVTNVSSLPSAPGEFVTLQNVDPSEYPNVTVYSRVNTTKGVNGTLESSQLRVFENGHEYPIRNLKFTEGTTVDVVFVFDDSGSMGGEIGDMKRGISDLTTSIEDAGIDARYGLVSFKDATEVDQPLTSDVSQFQSRVDALDATGGADLPEDSLDAIYEGTNRSYRNGTQRVVIHITDAGAHSETRTTHNRSEVETEIRTSGSEFYTVSPGGYGFKQLANDTGGVWTDIDDSDFGIVLDEIEGSLTNRYAVTYTSDRKADGTGRRVDLYANNSTGVAANDTGAYIAPSTVDRDCTGPDSDGDGLSDYCETEGIPLANGDVVTTDPNDPDTDGDGLPDGAEVMNTSERVTTTDGTFVGYKWESNPLEADTDGDGLNDSQETNGWNVSVNLTDDGEPLAWAPESTAESEIHVTSDPRDVNSDSDALTDYEEWNTTHTDPEKAVTYEVTNRHQSLLENVTANQSESDINAVVPGGTTLTDLAEDGLTDATDDSDFVMLERHEASGFDRMTFTAVDGEIRTDRWVSNNEEMAVGTDPWDPDTDNDGLTDGWELHGGTLYLSDRVYVEEPTTSPTAGSLADDTDLSVTSPTNPDTDGDGYWDGWIGVYGVDRTDNVILYRAHLDGGVTGNETVQAQVGYHNVSKVASSMGADIDDDGDKEHSNVHIGERQWGTDPDVTVDAPSPSTTLELDRFENISGSLQSSAWVDSVEENFAIYGINVTIIESDPALTHEDLTDERGVLPAVDNRPPTNKGDLYSNHLVPTSRDVQDKHQDTSTGTYTFVSNQSANVPGTPFFPGQGGVHWSPPLGPDIIALFDTGIWYQTANVPDSMGFTSDEENQSVAQMTMVHEIGHGFSVGELDDKSEPSGPFNLTSERVEIYSGYDRKAPEEDPTPEFVYNERSDEMVDNWTVMASGSTEESYLPPANGRYFPFSIEEVMSIESSG